MHLYHLTLQPPSALTHAVYGNFSGGRAQEILVARGRILELLRLDDAGRLVSIIRTDVFGVIRSLMPFRLTGSNRDYAVVGSDSGRLVVLEVDGDHGKFKKIHQETFGRSGCRRIVPGELLATDPRGRALMIAAVEKQKFVYILNRDATNRLTISSPLEAHKSHSLCFALVGVDVHFENPIFACIEVDYNEQPDLFSEESETGGTVNKSLTFYELDLGLNHVVRKMSDPIDPGANMLISVPGGGDGPGGVLICAENFVYWKNIGKNDVAVAIPRRADMDPERGLLLVAHATHRRKDFFFFLLQSEFGDLYRITLDYENDQVNAIHIHYFDTVPTAQSLVVLKTGFLFIAADAGNHVLYQFQSIGDEQEQVTEETEDENGFVKFSPRPLKHLALIEEVDSLTPMMDLVAKDALGEGVPQLYSLCGKDMSSTLRIMRHGLSVQEIAVSELPGTAQAVWTVKRNEGDVYDAFIVVSFANYTLVLSVGDTVEEVPEQESGFIASISTILAQQVGPDGMLQVHANGLRHIRTNKRVNEWRAPGGKTITRATANGRQVLVSLQGGELFYFEIDASGQLTEVAKKELGFEVSCLAVAPLPEGRQRARFVSVGDNENNVRVLSLDVSDCLQGTALQSMPSQPISLCIIEMKKILYLTIALQDGILLRTQLDTVTGELKDTRRRFLGAKPPKLFKLSLEGQSAMIALSSRSWIFFNYLEKTQLVPISYSTLDYAANFCSEQCPEGVVAISDRFLRIIVIENLGETFNSISVALRHTPRHLAFVPGATNRIAIIETDHDVGPPSSKGKIPVAHAGQIDDDMDIDEEAKAAEQENHEETNGAQNQLEIEEAIEPWIREQRVLQYRAGPGHWISLLRLVDVQEAKTIDLVKLDPGEAAFSICTLRFHSDSTESSYVAVGVVKKLVLQPKSFESAAIVLYKVSNKGELEFQHKTMVDNIPGVLCAFQGRLLAGVGGLLRIYDLGKKKLLRKCESKPFPTLIKTLDTQGDRIVVGDLAESFHFVKYRRAENQLVEFADDISPRWVTAACLVDYDTVAGGDKFGNIFLLRLPREVSEENDSDNVGGHFKATAKALNGAPFKANIVAQVHIGEPVISLQRVSLIPGGADILLYGTIHGAVGVLMPFTSKDSIDFFSHLEMHMRQEKPPLCGRNHLTFRSYYFPVKDVIDGDLCEQFSTLDEDTQQKIADELDRTINEIFKKMEDTRNRIL